MKFPTEFRVGENIGDQVASRQCYLSTVLPRQRPVDGSSINQIMEIDTKDILETPLESTCVPLEETKEIEVKIGNPERTTRIGKGLQGHDRQMIIDPIREFFDIFTWDPTQMPGYP